MKRILKPVREEAYFTLPGESTLPSWFGGIQMGAARAKRGAAGAGSAWPPAVVPSPKHLRRELGCNSSNLCPTSSSPGQILLGPRWGESPASLRVPFGFSSRCLIPSLGAAGAGGARMGQRVRGAVSGKQAGSSGGSVDFLRQGARGSAPGASPPPPVSWYSNTGLVGGERGFLLRSS